MTSKLQTTIACVHCGYTFMGFLPSRCCPKCIGAGHEKSEHVECLVCRVVALERRIAALEGVTQKEMPIR